MARSLRVEFPGAIYHVTVRMLGDWKREKNLLFEDDADRERFLSRLGERVEQYDIRMYLYCLLSNHVHLVFETPSGNCSKFMQSLSTAYTVYFNLRHGRHGHLLDGRYRARLVEGGPASPRLRRASDYLLALTRYVHLNPVRVKAHRNKPMEEKIKLLRGYRWSTYPSYIGRRKAIDFVEYGPVLAQMSGLRSRRPAHYRAFVETGLAEDDEDFQRALKASPRCIGSDDFRAWIDERYQELVEGHAVREDVSFRHITEPLRVKTILQVVAEAFEVEIDALRQRRRNSPLRAVAAQLLLRYGGLTQREAAVRLHMGTGGAVSAQVRRLPELLAEQRRLRRTVKLIEGRLDGLKKAGYDKAKKRGKKGR